MFIFRKKTEMIGLLIVSMSCALLPGVKRASAAEPAAPLVFVQGGEPKGVIVLQPQAGELERFAVKELNTYIKKSTGTELPVVVGTLPKDKPAILAGNGPLLNDLGIDLSKIDLGFDGFISKRINNVVVLAGKANGGTLYACYDFLERFLNIYWIWPGELGEIVPASKELVVNDLDIVSKPDFTIRHFYWGGLGKAAEPWRLWGLRNRGNRWVPGKGNPGWQGTASHGWQMTLPFDKYPEVYALVDGKRKNWQICTTNETAIANILENARKYFDKNPGIEAIDIGPRDGGDFCECEKCKALDDPGDRDKPVVVRKMTRRLLVFYSRICGELKKIHPDRFVAALAYFSYQQPPKDKTITAPDNMLFNYSLYSPVDYAHAVTDPRTEFSRISKSELAGWAAICKHMIVYQYTHKSAWEFQFFPIAHTEVTNLRFLKQLGYMGRADQAYEDYATNGLNYYIAGRLQWNCDQKFEDLVGEYCRLFGKGAEAMKEFYLTMEKAMEDDPGSISGVCYASSRLIFTPAVLKTMAAYLGQADRLVQDDPLGRKRLDLIKTVFDYTRSIAGGADQFYQCLDAGLPREMRLARLQKAIQSQERALSIFDKQLGPVGSSPIFPGGWSTLVIPIVRDDLALWKKLYIRWKNNVKDPIEVPTVWRSKRDPKEQGVKGKWFASDFDDSGWDTVKTLQVREGSLGDGWYRCRVDVPSELAGKALFLHLEGVRGYSWYYLNGQLIGQTENLTWPKEFEATRAVKFGQPNTLVVRTYNRGTSGIYGEVSFTVK